MAQSQNNGLCLGIKRELFPSFGLKIPVNNERAGVCKSRMCSYDLDHGMFLSLEVHQFQ